MLANYNRYFYVLLIQLGECMSLVYLSTVTVHTATATLAAVQQTLQRFKVLTLIFMGVIKVNLEVAYLRFGPL